MVERPPGPVSTAGHRTASVIAALLGSLLLLFLFAPILELVATGGGRGVRKLFSDAELRSALALTAITATSATLVGVVAATPLAYLLARRNFRGRAVIAAILDLPLLILHGTADKVTNPKGSQFFYETAGSSDKTLKLYDGHVHDLLNDLGRETVMADVVNWIGVRS